MNFKILLLAAFTMIFMSCNKDQELSKSLDGKWELVSTSGTISGGGISTLWDIAIVKDGALELFKSGADMDELVATGKIKEKSLLDLLYEIEIEESFISEDLSLEFDPEKTIEVIEGKMDWISPCCDRVNYHLEKE